MSVVPLGGLLGLTATDASDTGRPTFVALGDVPALTAQAEMLGLVPVVVEPLRPADRGKLALVLEEAIESALDRRGACPPGVGASADLDASLGDQLYRARLVEARGLFVFLGNLAGVTSLGGALDAEDSAVLRWWLDAPRTRPLRLLLDGANRSVGVYGPPLPLASFVDAPATIPNGLPAAAPHVAPDLAASSETMELSEPPPAVRASTPENRPAAPSPSLVGELAEALVDELCAESGDRPSVGAELLERSELDQASDEASAMRVADESNETSAVHAVGDGAADPESGAATGTDASDVSPHLPEASDVLAAALASSETPVTPPVFVEEPPTVVEELPPTRATHGPLHPAAASEWRSWARELELARGPKPLAAVERMFVMNYVPLRDAYLRGIAPSEALPVLEGWAKSFASSYREAFDALRLRGKRPTMVLDVPDVAMRIGRLHGARSVQLLLVDGLRFDLGLRVELGLRARLGREVALTERLLLWSALPSDTATQLELIGRGAEGLRDFTGAAENEVPVARGRMARTPRRVKAGHRELLKLDLVEARLAELGPAENTRLDALGDEVTDAVAELCEKLPPRTLLFVFGDHGFRLEPQGEGTGALVQGGSRPEEVLVPAFAWLVGGVQ